MYKSRELFNIQTSIDNLSNKFTELENSYYSFLQKSQEENENIISKEVDVNSEFFQSLLKEQSYLQNNVKHLTALEKSFNEELNHLRSLIRHSKEEQTSNAYGDYREIQTLVEYGLNSLHENVFSIEGIKSLEQKVGNKIQHSFNNTSELFNQAFSEFPFISKENIDDILSFNKLDDLYNVNSTLFEALDFESDTLKATVSGSLKNINRFSNDFTKEAQTLQDYLNKARQEASNFLKHAKQKKSYGETDQVVKIIEQALAESTTWDSKKNETFVNIKGQIEEISKSVRNYLRDFKKQFESIKANNDIMKSVTEVLKSKSPEVSTGTFPNPHAHEKEEYKEHKHSAIHSKLQLQTSGSKKVIPSVKTGKDHDDLSSIRGEHSSHEISSSKENKTNQLIHDLEVEKTIRRTREQLEGLLINIGQRFGYLKTSSKSLLMSSGKLMRLLIKKGGEDDFVLKVYENDKKAFENYLNAVEEAITTSKEKLERLRTKSSKKSISATLPLGATSKQSDRKRNGHHKKPGDPKIKALIDDFEKKHGEVFRSVSPKNRRDDSPPLGGIKKDKSQDVMLSSEGFHKTLPTFGSPRENSPQLKSLEFELLLLQKRCEELGKERDRLKKEIVDAKKQPSTTDLMPKVQELSEHNDRLAKDNAKLVKLAKKLEQKAVERKSNLKKLFDLMEEKEKELNYYKLNNKETPKNLNQVSKQVEEFVNHKQNEMKKQYENLVKVLNEKEESLSYLEDFVSKVKPALLNSSSKRGNISQEQSALRGSSSKEDTVVLDKKKRHINELINQISTISAAHLPKIKEVVNFLKGERDDIGERLKQTKLSVLDQSDRSNVSKDKINPKSSARDLDEFKEKIKQQVEQIHELEVERDDLAERCNELVGEIEVAQDLRKKVEKNYQEEIGVLNNKIHQLNEYIQEMEVKNNEKFRGSLTGEKWKKATTVKDEAQEREEIEQRELIEGLQIELQEALGRIDEAAEYLGVVDEGYNESGVVARLEVVIGGFLAREEEFGKKYQEMEGDSSRQENRERGDTEARNEEAIDDLINKNNALEGLVETIKIELNERTEDNKELSDMLLVKDNEIEKLSVLVKEKETESQKVVEEFKALEEFSEKVEAEYQGHIEKLANLLANYGIPIDTTETELTVFAEQLVETLDSTLEAVARMKQDLEAQGGEVPEGGQQTSSRGDIQELAAENEALREALENMNSELEQVKNEKEQIMGDFEGLVAPEEFETVRERKEELEKEIEELKALLQEKESILNERDNRVAEISELLIVKDQAIKEFESQRSETKSKFSKNMDEMNAKFWKETEQYNIKVQNLSKQAAKLKEQLQTAAVELEEVKQQNEELFQIKLHLEEELIAKSDEFDNYKNEVENNQQNRGAENTERMGELERQIEEVKTEIDRRDQLIIQVNEEKTAVENELERVYHEVEDFEKQFEAVKEEKLALEKALAEAREEIAVLVEKLKEKEEEANNIKFELKDADAEIEELGKQKEELEAQLHDVSARYEQLEAQLQETHEADAQREELEAQLEATSVRCEELERHLQESIAQKEDVEEASKDLQAELQRRLEGSQEEINSLKEQVQQLEQELKKRTEEKKKEVDCIKETNNLLQSDMSFFKATQEELSKQIEAKVKENKQKEERIQKLVASIEEYDQALKESNLDLERKDQALDEIRETMDKLTEANTRLEETLKEMEQAAHERGGDTEELENQIQALQEENEQLKAHLEEQEEVIEKAQALEQENELLKKQIKENETLLDDKDTEIRELEYEREKFLDEVNEYKRAKEEELEAIKSESDIDRTSRQDLETANLQMKNEFEKLEQTVETLKQELTEKENHLESIQNILPQRDDEIKLLKEDIEALRGQIMTQAIENEGTLAQNQITIKEQADAIQEKDLKIAQYQAALETAESKIQSLEKELSERQDEKEHLTRQVSNMGEEMEIIREHKEETLKGKAQVEKDSISRLESMGSRIQELEGTVTAANTKIDELQEELNNLREQKEQLDNQLEAELSAKEEVNSEIEGLKLKISNYESKIESDKARLAKVEEELRVSKDENEMYVELLENKEADIVELNTKLAELDKGAEISHELQALRVKIATYESQIESDKARLESVEEELRLSREENEKFVELLESKEAELLDLNTKLTAYEKGAEKEAALLNEFEALRGKTSEYETQIQQVNQEIALLQQEIEQLKADNRGLEEELNTKDATIAEYDDKVSALEAQLKESEKERENLIIIAETREREFNDLKDTLSGKENELVERRLALEREKDEEIKTLREGVTEYKEKFEESRKQNEGKIKEMEHKVEVKDQELAAQASLMQEKDTEIDALKTWYSEAETKLKEAQQQIETLQKEIENLNSRFEEYEGTIAQAETRVTQLEEELAVATENNQNLQQEIDTLEITLENERARLQEVEEKTSEIANKEAEIKSLQDQIRLKETEIEKVNAALNEVEEEYHEENQRLHDEINHLRGELEHKEELHNQDMNSLNEEFGELRNIILEKDEELNHKDEEINGLTAKVTELEKKLEAAEALKTDRSPMTRFDKFTEGNDFDNFQHQFDQFEDFEESFSADFKKKGGLVAKAQEKRDELHEKVINLEGQITGLKASENNLKGEVEELRMRLAEKEGKVTSRGSLEGAHERIEQLEKEVDELNALLMMRNNEMANMRTNTVLESQRAKTEHDEQIDQLNENIEELRLRNEEILNELEAVQNEYDVLKRSYDSLQVQNDKLHLEFKEYKEKDALAISRGRTSEAMRSPEFSPEKPIGESLDVSDPDQLRVRLADYERKVEKLKVDRRGLKETNHNLKEENGELRKTMKMFQEQIVMLNQTSRQEAPSSQSGGQNEVAVALKESFSVLQGLKAFRGRFDFKGDDAQEVKKAMNFIRETLHNQELEIEHLNQVVEENKGTISSQDKLHEEAQKEINLLEEAMVHKLSLLLTETESILRDVGLDTPPVNQDLRTRHDLIQEEKLIYSCLRALRMVAQEAKSQKTAAPQLTRGVSNTSGPESKNLSLQIRPIPYNDTSPSKTGESSNRRRGRDKIEPSFSAPDEADDAKARSFIEEESYDIEKELQARPDIGSPQTEKEYIQRLLGEIRNLQDENDQLDSEYKQLKNDFEIMKFLNEDLKADIVDKDERIKKLLETMMNEKGENKGDKFDEEKARHEKEHMKKIFLKFIDSALQGSKDAEELFKVLLTMFEIPEQDKNMLLTGFKSKSAKKGMFSKMFK